MNVEHETCDSLTCKEGNGVVNVKLESAMNTFETSVNVKNGSLQYCRAKRRRLVQR